MEIDGLAATKNEKMERNQANRSQPTSVQRTHIHNQRKQPKITLTDHSKKDGMGISVR